MEKCSYCNGLISFIEMSSEAGLWYHDKCIKMKYLKRYTILEGKIKTGQITFEEANEYKEVTQLLENIKNTVINLKPKDAERVKNKIKTTKSDQLITRPIQREKVLRSNSDSDFKRLEAARPERWAWEALAVIETQLALSSKEQFQLTDGKRSSFVANKAL